MAAKPKQPARKPSAADLAHITPSLRSLAVPIGSITLDPRNARTHGEKNQRSIRNSLTKFGQQQPILADAQGIVIAGNGRLEVARELGWKWIAVSRSHLSGMKARAYAIADNRTSELASWDLEELNAQLEEIKNFGIEPDDLEFTQDDLDQLLAGADVDADESAHDDDKKGTGSGSASGNPQYMIIVECRDEKHQRELCQRFIDENLPHRTIVPEE